MNISLEPNAKCHWNLFCRKEHEAIDINEISHQLKVRMSFRCSWCARGFILNVIEAGTVQWLTTSSIEMQLTIVCEGKLISNLGHVRFVGKINANEPQKAAASLLSVIEHKSYFRCRFWTASRTILKTER